MRIRAVCTDIDGTLLDKDRELSSRTIAAIQCIKDKVAVILASSRMPDAMRHLQYTLGIEDHPMICFNGAYVLCFEKESETPRVSVSVHIPLAIATTILDLASVSARLHISLFCANDWYADAHDQWTLREAAITKVAPVIMPLKAALEKWGRANLGIHKIMCMGNESDIDSLYHALNVSIAHVVHLYRSKNTYLEIAPKAVSKSTALAFVMKEKLNGTLRDAMAFGDNYNDVDMIRNVGFGVAVGNAIPEVKAVAKEITLNSKADGVAVVLEKYFGN